MRAGVILSDGDVFVSIFDDGPSVMVYVQIVWRREDGDNGGKLFGWGFAEHGVATRQVSKR